MATFTLCDICAAPRSRFLGREMWKLKVLVDEHPHDRKPILREIDICNVCLRVVEDFQTHRTVEQIQALLTEGA